LVGTNINGVNAFFVRSDLVQSLFPIPHTSENLYNPLRLFLTFKSGHLGDTCLINPKLQMEYLFNETNENYVTVYGFHSKEVYRGTSHQWMCQKKAAAFLKVGEQHGDCLEIQIPYSSINFEQYGIEKPMLHVQVEEYGLREIFDLEEHGLIIIYLDVPLATGQIVKIEFEISNLWTPAIVLGTDDNRELGIAIHGIEAGAGLMDGRNYKRDQPDTKAPENSIVSDNPFSSYRMRSINSSEQNEVLKTLYPISKENARNIRLSVIEHPEISLEPNDRCSIKVLLTNNSTIELMSAGDNPLLVSYRWIDNNGNIVVNDGYAVIYLLLYCLLLMRSLKQKSRLLFNAENMYYA